MKPTLALLPLAMLALSAAAEPARDSQVAQATVPAPSTETEASTTAPPRRAATGGFRPVFRAGVDDALVEVGRFSDAPEADLGTSVRVSPYALWQPQRGWEFRVGARIDGTDQSGGAQSFGQWRVDLGDTYARWRSGDTRVTVGAQTIVWGRVDEIPLIDRVSRVDLTRFVLDDLPERRRPQLALRWEQTLGDFKADAVLLPAFRGARLADDRSVWSLVNRQSGEIIGVAPSPALAALARSAPIRQDHDGTGGAALRLTRTGAPPFDVGLTLARTRQSVPYFRIDPTRPLITAVHPYNNFVGADLELVAGGLTWRGEVGITEDVPVTATDGRELRTRALDWVGAVEFFPGGEDTRVSLQLVGRSLRTGQALLELKEYYGVNGEVETTFDQGRWRLSARFFSGLNVHDVYLAPRLSYLAWEPHELFVTARHFAGERRTLGGFHRDHDMLAIGVRTKF